MAIIVPNQAELNILTNAVNFDGGGLRLRLFKNDMTPDANTVLADFTEANFDGYAQADAFSVPASGGDGKAKTELLNHVFTKAAGATPNTIYGWFVVHVNASGGSAKLMACKRRDAPHIMGSTGDTITLSVTLTLREEP